MKNHLPTGTETFQTSLRFKKITLKIRRIIVLLLFICANFHLINAQTATLDYTEIFDPPSITTAWKLINGSQANYWKIGARDKTSVELFITNGSGTTNDYVGTKSVVHAYREIAIPNGVSEISIDYAYKCVGNSNSYFRVWVVPATFTPVAGTAITADITKILINSGQSSSSWVDPSPLKTVTVESFAGSTIRLVYEWINSDGSALNNPGAAIDKINVRNLCQNIIQPIQGGPSTVCVGLNTPAFTNATIGGSWSVVNGTGTATISNGGILTGVTAGTVKVLYTTTKSCVPASYTVTVNATPDPTVVSGGGTFCGSTTISATGGTNGTMYYQGTTSGGTSTTTASTSQTITASGTYYFRSRNNSGCWGKEGSVTIVINPVLSTVASNPIPANASTTVCYQGIGAISNITWGTVTGATSYDVYFRANTLPTTLTANVTSNSFSTGVLTADTTYYWKIVPRNSCGISTGTPIEWSFKTSPVPCACKPVISTPSDLYLNSFQFVGTLNDNPNPNLSGPSGYTDYTNLTPVVKQPQGSVLNIVSSALGSDGKPKSGYWKAWVDYNGDGTFSSAEQVYNLTSLSTESLTFGFVIPVSTPVGKYRFRIRVADTKSFESCSTTTNGETEDYVFEVIADCAAKINTAALKDEQRCGTGTVKLEATGTGTGIKWYAAPTGGAPLFDGLSYTTDIIPENTRKTYYVVAYNGNCESAFRIPVTAIANPGPAVSFGTVPSFCEPTTSGQLITAANGTRLDVLLSETFDSGLGKFEQSKTESGYLNEPNTYWINRPSPYIPPSKTDTPAGPYEGLAPALSSGYTGGNFAMSNTDLSRKGTLLNRMTLTNNLITTNFLNLKLDFDLYYFTLITAADSENYFSVDYSVDGGLNWINLPNVLNLSPVPTKPDIYTNQGNPNIWKKISLDLPSSVLDLTTFKIRFSSYSFGKTGSTSFKESIAAIDNVKIYGIKDESSKFGWSSPVNGILYESDCTTPLNSKTASTICIKPDQAQFENNVNFSISASASFSNGCPALGTIVVANDLKVYDIATSNVWNNTANWKPGATVPTADKCVIIKKPVSLISGNGLAKNITIEPGGSLTINKDRTLKVVDYIKNNTTVDNAKNLVVESDGNLIQVNNGAANSGNMIAKREVKNLRYRPGIAIDYVYWSSPVSGQPTKGPGGFSPGTPNNLFFYYRESNDRFYETGDPTFTPGRGYAVRAEGVGITPTTYTKTYEFKGTPNNGNIYYPIIRSADNPTGVVHGYNLVGNPYPSNIDFNELYLGNLNGNLIHYTAWFWTNNIYTPSQMGSDYGGNNYAIFNGTGGVPATSPYTGGLKPNGIIKVGQAFIVQKKTAGTAPLEFKNTYGAEHDLRKTGTGSIFFQKNNNGQNKFWISLIGPAQMVNSQLIGYMPGATNGYEQDFDAEAFDDYSDLFYSVLEDKKLVIQGKSDSFTVEDRVPLGANFYQNGVYKISLDNAEGIFNTGQTIYLKDKQAGITANLSEGSYTFQAAKGLSKGRFEIVYKPDVVLITDNKVKNEVEVYRDSDHFVVKAQNKKITSIQVFDASGRLIYSVTPNSLQTVIPADKLLNSIYVVKISQGGIISTTKIMK